MTSNIGMCYAKCIRRHVAALLKRPSRAISASLRALASPECWSGRALMSWENRTEPARISELTRGTPSYSVTVEAPKLAWALAVDECRRHPSGRINCHSTQIITAQGTAVITKKYRYDCHFLGPAGDLILTSIIMQGGLHEDSRDNPRSEMDGSDSRLPGSGSCGGAIKVETTNGWRLWYRGPPPSPRTPASIRGTAPAAPRHSSPEQYTHPGPIHAGSRRLAPCLPASVLSGAQFRQLPSAYDVLAGRPPDATARSHSHWLASNVQMVVTESPDRMPHTKFTLEF